MVHTARKSRNKRNPVKKRPRPKVFDGFWIAGKHRSHRIDPGTQTLDQTVEKEDETGLEVNQAGSDEPAWFTPL
jgi:hypothetical protein